MAANQEQLDMIDYLFDQLGIKGKRREQWARVNVERPQGKPTVTLANLLVPEARSLMKRLNEVLNSHFPDRSRTRQLPVVPKGNQ